MSHIIGRLKWSDAVFSSFDVAETGLILFLNNSTKRSMNFDNWEESYPITLKKLKELKAGDLIKFATWNGYDEKVWFCDVELR